ncbi:hypothetical protein FPV16_23160 [Methylobacterium sp. W2]|uniref:transcription termination/antitermination protein NusG n=1 Tax=Methylobacterium sp. W2 TaxID=2598107 RepID=UPI001D0C534D|nr:hypothetical protein [Methylobacterium sp. W2]MCC0809063.1 hypothetical protein [Methylobacterium sp. W2]
MARRDKKQRLRDRNRRRQERRLASAMSPTAAAPAKISADPQVGAAPFAIDASLSWHVVRIAPRMKDLALKAISGSQAVTFQPCTMEVVIRRGRRIDTLRPTLARTVFIGVEDEGHLEVVRREFEARPSAPPVAEVVCYMTEDTTMKGNIDGQVLKPARLDPIALQHFANNVFKNEQPAPVVIAVGQRVIVTDGPFLSLPAEIEEVMPTGRVKVSVSMFGAPVPVELELAQVQLVA